jgi:hypothetical protein
MKPAILSALATACIACGCAAPETTSASDLKLTDFALDRPTSALLFNRQPDVLPPDLFAARSDWPSVPREVRTGEVEVFDVTVYDQQAGDLSPSGFTWDDYQRTFRSRRSGAAFR